MTYTGSKFYKNLRFTLCILNFTLVNGTLCKWLVICLILHHSIHVDIVVPFIILDPRQIIDNVEVSPVLVFSTKF